MPEKRSDWGSSLLGAGAFLLGVGLIVFTFQQAWQLFQTPPGTALGFRPGKPLEVEAAGGRLLWIVMQVLLLTLMAGVGGAIAKWGIRMYGVKFTWPLAPKKPDPPLGG